jgi:hypothetical protein
MAQKTVEIHLPSKEAQYRGASAECKRMSFMSENFQKEQTSELKVLDGKKSGQNILDLKLSQELTGMG